MIQQIINCHMGIYSKETLKKIGDTLVQPPVDLSLIFPKPDIENKKPTKKK